MLLLACLATALAQDARVADATGPIVLDGRLDEPDWATAPPLSGLQRYRPIDGGPPPGETEVRFLQDERFLYVGVTVTGADYGVRARISPREAINADDQVGIYLDTFHDHRSGYIFYFNPLGIQQDIRQNNGKWNMSWSTAYRSRGTATEDSFTIEVAFPWRSLKYQPGGEQTWGVIITRKIPSEGSKYAYPKLERGHPALFSQAADLGGVKPAARGSGLELIPALTVSQDWPREDVGPREDPMRGLDSPLQVMRPSLDARFGITPDLGLAATLNPDFSQVESDVSDVRLNARFAFQFPETRPFFLDGSEFYTDRQKTLYTRSVNEPLYGVKVSGREGAWSVGALNSLDLTPLASFNENETPGFDEADIEGRSALNTVFRLRRDVLGTGTVGLALVDKRVLDFTLDQPLDTEAGRSTGTHQAATIDANVPLGGRWFVSGSTLQSITGTAEDGGRWGQGNEVSISRASGVGTGLELYASDRTPGLRQETGFLPQVGQTMTGGALDHTFTPDGWVQAYTPEVTLDLGWERNGEHRHELGTTHELVIAGIHTLELFGAGSMSAEGRQTDSPADSTTSPGMTDFTGWSVGSAYEGQIGAVAELEPELSLSRTLDFTYLVPATTTSVSLDGTLRPTQSLRLDARTRYNRHVPDGEQAQASTLTRGRLTWQFTQALGLRLVEEHISGSLFEDAALQSSALLSWLEVPGTAFYLGYTETAALAPYLASERVVFAKASVLLRP